MRRRALFVAASVCFLSASVTAGAQQQPGKKVWRVGYLAGSPRVPQIDAFVAGLRELGYVEGENVAIELKLAHGQLERLPQLAAELVRSQPDVIVTAANAGGLAAKNATSTIPIVVISSHDGVGIGLFASLDRPGANVTGIESLAPDLARKRLEFLKEAVPKLSRLAVLYNASDAGAGVYLELARSVGEQLGFEVQLAGVRTGDELDAAFAGILRHRPDALLTVSDPLVFANRKRIAEFTLQNKLPAVFEPKAFAELGGLMAYGPNQAQMWRRGAQYADKILKGAKPAELPVERPTKFVLVINLRTAKELDLVIPESLLLRADEVIE